MDSIVNKLTEIEDAASAIVAHAETQKEILDREYEEKRKAFDEIWKSRHRRASTLSGTIWKKALPVSLTARMERALRRSVRFKRNMKKGMPSMPAKS